MIFYLPRIKTTLQKIYIFNPENDLALAHAGANYVPPPHAVEIRRDLALLPAWIADDGDKVLVVDNQPVEQLQFFLKSQGLNIDVITPFELRRIKNARFVPWGWNHDLRRRLIKWGADPACLPSIEDIDRWRDFSHRRTVTVVLRRLLEGGNFKGIELPVELTTIEQVMSWAQDNHGGFLKAPWSGSGSGIWEITTEPDRDLCQWAAGVIRRQGSIIAEKGYDKLLDFAVEFYHRSGETSVYGYSIFKNDKHNQYLYGIVDKKENLHRKLLSYCPDFDNVVSGLLPILNKMLCEINYEGFLGVDMMMFNQNGEAHVNPCVEVNLRMTMGVVTAAIGEQGFSVPSYFSIFRPCDDTDKEIALCPPIGKYVPLLLKM